MSHSVQSRSAVVTLMLSATLCLSGCFEGSRELVQRPLEPVGDDDHQIAVIAIHGEIAPESSSGLVKGADAAELTLRLRAAGRDRHVRAVVLDLDTGGGDVTASDRVYHEVLAVRAAGKPVVAVMGSVCASGGYYIACAADVIITSPSSLTGSIGVIFESPDAHALIGGKLGIDVTVIKSGQYKDMGSPLRAMSNDERALLQAMVDQCYAQFLSVVAEHRKGHGPLNPDQATALGQIRTLADGRVMSGEQAITAGLADERGYLFEGITRARALAHIRETPQVISYERDNGLFGFSEHAASPSINAGIQVNASILPQLTHARLAYLWPAY